MIMYSLEDSSKENKTIIYGVSSDCLRIWKFNDKPFPGHYLKYFGTLIEAEQYLRTLKIENLTKKLETCQKKDKRKINSKIRKLRKKCSVIQDKFPQYFI